MTGVPDYINNEEAEWIKLMLEAKNLGITVQEVKAFLSKGVITDDRYGD